MSTTTATIYGLDIDIDEPTDGGVVTDIIVLARVVYMDDDGTVDDFVRVATTKTTTGIIYAGMLATVDDGDPREEDDDD